MKPRNNFLENFAYELTIFTGLPIALLQLIEPNIIQISIKYGAMSTFGSLEPVYKTNKSWHFTPQISCHVLSSNK